MSKIEKVLKEGLLALEELFERDYFGNHNVKLEDFQQTKDLFDEAFKELQELKKTQLKRMLRESEDGSEYVDGYYIDLDEVYCDIEKDKNGKWSVYFKDKSTNQSAWGDQVDIDLDREDLVPKGYFEKLVEEMEKWEPVTKDVDINDINF